MITAVFKNSRAETADGMRHWANYVREEVAKKVKGMTLIDQSGTSTTYRIGDTLCVFNIETDIRVFEVRFTLKATRPDGTESSSIPVGALVILMVFLHMLPGRTNMGRMITFRLEVNGKTYSETDREQVRAAYGVLKGFLPPKWYLPYAEGVMDAPEYFEKRSRSQSTPR